MTRSGSLQLWDIQSGIPQDILATNRSLLGFAFSPSGDIVATSYIDDTIDLWNTETGERLSTLSGHTNEISQVSFSPSGALLVSTSFDGTIRFWGMP